ncbi:hypothetical protein EA473_07500 [Natrarchaeobius chitinivorans]|uniref:DUF8163 domain-containing protein n=2 Tax=Natrarchaeobius chitinivorans TaxID=1679083 RepID=A0A3N6MJJ9_NATCH|nr:hypothetical protein EA473_07500 [Natrarchaeobius chitinivorans]
MGEKLNLPDIALETATYHWMELVAVPGICLCFGLVFGPLGIVAGAVVAGMWALFGVPYALALGHVFLVALLPGTGIGSEIVAIGIIELGFGTLLLGSLLRRSAELTIGFVAIGSLIALGGLVWAVQSRSLGLGAGVTVVVLAVASYGIHRYELVALGLVSETVAQSPSNSPTSPRDPK